MTRLFSVLFLTSLLLMNLGAFQVFAQETDKEPGEVRISIYSVAPGKHLDFLKWMAEQESIDKEAGVPATQWYAHRDGASWDYIAIGPVLTAEQEEKADGVATQKGLPTGFKASIKFRTFIASHTDTFARGPVSASQLVKAAE